MILRIFFIIFLACWVNVFAQQVSVVKYFVTGNFFKMKPLNKNHGVFEYLLYNNQQSFYFNTGFHNSDWSINSVIKNFDLKKGNVKILSSISHPTDLTLIASKKGSRDKLLVSDEINLHWTIHQDSIHVLGFKAIRATTEFRGRKYVAFFAPDIPISLGPWKLRGLPGLILKAYDTTHDYEYMASKILLNSQFFIPQTVDDFVNEHRGQELFFRDYIQVQNEKIKKTMQKLEALNSQNGAVIHRFNPRDFYRERTFEWEIPKNNKQDIDLSSFKKKEVKYK